MSSGTLNSADLTYSIICWTELCPMFTSELTSSCWIYVGALPLAYIPREHANVLSTL